MTFLQPVELPALPPTARQGHCIGLTTAHCIKSCGALTELPEISLHFLLVAWPTQLYSPSSALVLVASSSRSKTSPLIKITFHLLRAEEPFRCLTAGAML